MHSLLSNRFMRDEQVPKPIMLYMPADVYGFYGYAAWRFVSGVEMKAYRIPANLFKNVSDEGLTLERNLQVALNVEITKKYAFSYSNLIITVCTTDVPK